MKGKKMFRQVGLRLLFIAALVAPLLATGAGSAAAAAGTPGAVYVLTNSAAGNEVAVFDRSADGTLSPAGAYATGGLGTGAGLGSQGALVLSQNDRWLFAVDAGSSEISVFEVRPDGLTLADKIASGGLEPISLTRHGRLLYVLNAGGSGNITGFFVGRHGHLSPIPNSTRALSNNGIGAAPGPAQVSFSPNGDMLIVTEKATNLIDTYAVDDGRPSPQPTTHASSGATPFGFAFDKRGALIVSEAFGGATDQSAVSSYRVFEGKFEVISSSIPDNQTAACWIAVTKDGKYAYTTNTGSGSISSYRVSRDGRLALLDSRAGDTGNGSTPVDMAFSRNSRYLYVLGAGSQAVSAFRVQSDGSLAAIDRVGGLPTGSVGVAAR